MLGASEELGQRFIEAVRARDASRTEEFLRMEFFWGDFYNRLNEEEKEWGLEIAQKIIRSRM